ncbi:RES domain-containing protein [Candidatus Bipolaricaulota bacterium]|nr:RES domain-containing protein [Candidatus Bipolaricaulota bacterium]
MGHAKYIKDLSGTGARIVGGRWNNKGSAVVYAAQSRALAVLESLVHFSPTTVPKNYKIATLYIPDTVSQAVVSMKALPKDWKLSPPPSEIPSMGTKWLDSNTTLILIVPSAIVSEEKNLIINPAHLEMDQVQLVNIEKFTFDKRLFARPAK